MPFVPSPCMPAASSQSLRIARFSFLPMLFPPAAVAIMSISFALRSVFFKITFAPLESVSSFAPNCFNGFSFTILPALGSFSIIGSSFVLST